MSILSEPYFHDERAAIAKLEAIVWPEGPVCPRCHGSERITAVKGGRSGLRRCGPCKREFTVKVGTVFEKSHVGLHLWFQAAHLLASSKKGISSHQLHRTLGVTYKTAWFMEHRLREAMRELHPMANPMGGGGRIVEVDDTFVGGLEKNKHRDKRMHLGRGPVGKEAVVGLVERGGRVRTQHVPAVNGRTLAKILYAHLSGETVVYTDDGRAMLSAAKTFDKHDSVRHSIGEYVRNGVHTNTIEGYFSIMKRGINGVYHHISQQHLKRYLAEFDFRYNERSALGVQDAVRCDTLVAGIVGKRLTYRDSCIA